MTTTVSPPRTSDFCAALCEITSTEVIPHSRPYADAPALPRERKNGLFPSRSMPMLRSTDIIAYCNLLKELGFTIDLREEEITEGSDAGYQFDLVGGYAIQILVWEGDEEFPPNAQVIYSDNFAEGFAAEDRVVAGDILISTIKTNM